MTADCEAAPAEQLEDARVFLMQGALHCTGEPTVITTVLGSCVSVCLWEARSGIGGMNHFVMPGSAGNAPEPLRYGPEAMAALHERVTELGAPARLLRAKVFGGAGVIPLGRTQYTVGGENVRLALDWLTDTKIPVVAQYTGGRQGLVIRFSTRTGDVMLRRVGSAEEI